MCILIIYISNVIWRDWQQFATITLWSPSGKLSFFFFMENYQGWVYKETYDVWLRIIENYRGFHLTTVRAGNLGQISTLTHDCGTMGSLNVLLQREDWLILIWASFSSLMVSTYFFNTLPVYPKNLKFLGFRFCG